MQAIKDFKHLESYTKIIEKKRAKNADDRVNYVSCASLEGDYDFISETVA